MTISNADLRVQTAGDGTTTAFPFTMQVSATTDVVVYLQETGGIPAIQTEGVDYSVALSGSPPGSSGGTVNFLLSAPLAVEVVTIILDPALTQETDLPTGGPFPADSVETALDKLLNIAKRTRDLVTRQPALFEGDIDGSGRYNANSNRISSLADAIDPQDGITLSQAQALVAAAFTTDFSAALEIVLASIQAYNPRNYFPNPEFRFWQLGTSITAATPFVNNDGNYICDGSILVSDGNDIVDAARDTTDKPQGTRAALKLTVNSAQEFGVVMPIEYDDILSLHTEPAGIELDIKATGFTEVTIDLLQWTGTANDFPRDPIQTWNGIAATPTLKTNWTSLVSTDLTVTTSWASYRFDSIVSSLPGATNNLALFIRCNDATVQAGDILRVSKLRLHNQEIGVGQAAPTGYVSRSYDEELKLNQRYYWKTFDPDTAPAPNLGLNGAVLYNPETSGSDVCAGRVQFPVSMRVSPTMSFHTPTAASPVDEWSNSAGTVTVDVDNAATRPNTQGCPFSSVNKSNSTAFYIHVSADARLGV